MREPKVTLVVGLPGSGKSRWALQHLEDHLIFDDPGIPVGKDAIKAQILKALLGEKPVAIVDPYLCRPEAKDALLKWLHDICPKCQITWVFFENDVATCWANASGRQGKVVGLPFIQFLAKSYFPPPDAFPCWRPVKC